MKLDSTVPCIALCLLVSVFAVLSSDPSDGFKHSPSHAETELAQPDGLFRVPGLRDYAEESRFPYTVDPQFAQRPDFGLSSNPVDSYKPEFMTQNRQSDVKHSLIQTSDKNLDGILDPALRTKGDMGGEPHTRNRRVIVVYPHFDFEDDHHHHHEYGTKKGHGHGHGGYAGGYGSSTHYHPDPQPPPKYGYGSKYGSTYDQYGGKGKKYYRRLRGPLSPILNWYYFGYL